jgi:hypothetical protein
MVQATSSLVEKIGKAVPPYTGFRRDLIRFLALESVRRKNSPAQWQALMGENVSLEELAEWIKGEGFEADPGYNRACEIAARTVNKLGDSISVGHLKDIHGIVKRDIKDNGINSKFIYGIDVAEIIAIINAEDFLAEAEMRLIDRSFIPFRTDILG